MGNLCTGTTRLRGSPVSRELVPVEQLVDLALQRFSQQHRRLYANVECRLAAFDTVDGGCAQTAQPSNILHAQAELDATFAHSLGDTSMSHLAPSVIMLRTLRSISIHYTTLSSICQCGYACPRQPTRCSIKRHGKCTVQPRDRGSADDARHS